MLRQRLEHLHLMKELLVALGGLLGFVNTALDHVQIRHDQLHIDGLNIPHGVHGHIGAGIRHHVHDILVIKATDHMDDGIGLANIGQKLVAKA